MTIRIYIKREISSSYTNTKLPNTYSYQVYDNSCINQNMLNHADKHVSRN